ncbi:hypothetical protein CK203_022882 [Vitis vinifera]|nr:hypothetical protein CK203_022882 [Vitis vinifera]
MVAYEDEDHPSAFLKDTSTNGTYLNWEKLKKNSPESMLHHGDIISFAAPPDHASPAAVAASPHYHHGYGDALHLKLCALSACHVMALSPHLSNSDALHLKLHALSPP